MDPRLTGSCTVSAVRRFPPDGSRSVKTAPVPGSLRASAVPPCAAGRWRTLGRPRPLPPASSRRNRSKPYGSSPGAIPLPVSVTSSTTSSPGPARRQSDGAARRGVAQGVGDQAAERLPHPDRVGVQPRCAVGGGAHWRTTASSCGKANRAGSGTTTPSRVPPSRPRMLVSGPRGSCAMPLTTALRWASIPARRPARVRVAAYFTPPHEGKTQSAPGART